MEEIKKKPKQIFVQGAIPPAIVADSIAKHATKTDIGAHHIFLGQVRADRIGDRQVTAIEYTAYEEVAMEKMTEIREAVFARYPLSCLHVYHSLGRVGVGELCFFVFTSSAHRGPAQEACKLLVDRIKGELPIWGKELFGEEGYQWKENN